MIVIIFSLLVMLYGCSVSAMDIEMVPHTSARIQASDGKLIKGPREIIGGLQNLLYDHAQSRCLLTAVNAYCAAQTLKQFVTYLQHPEHIELLESPIELEGILHMSERLGASSEFQSLVQQRLSELPRIDDSDVRGESLNLAHQRLRSCIGLERWHGSSIEELMLGNNNIERFDLADLQRIFPCLRRLDISHNNVSTLRRAMIANMAAGFSLDFSHNKVRKMQKGVFPLFKALQDRNISIHLHDTNLKNAMLEDIGELVNGVSWRRRIKQGAFMVGGIASVLCGCALGTVSGVLRDAAGPERPFTVASGFCFGGLLIGTATGLVLVALSHFTECLASEDSQPSRFYY